LRYFSMTRFSTCLLPLLLSSGLALLGSCIDRYTPDVAPADQTSLVVDGFLNPAGSSVIKLSRTFSVNTKNTAPAETKAQVTILDDAGRRYPLAESPAGTCTAAATPLDPSRQYQLRLTTAQGREYASDLEPVAATPPIDSLTWRLTPEQGVQLYVNTHGAATGARYYRWDYEETWQFTSAFESSIEYVPSRNNVRARGASIFRCWRTEASTAILQGNTTQLSQNTLASFPLVRLPPDSKLLFGYSLLVRQVAQSQAEYAYWETLRKNTENLGTVNDPLPARVTGNVHALANPAEPVLGYVGVHAVAQKRLFIDGAQFPTPRPTSVFLDPAYAPCVLEKLAPGFAFQQFKIGADIPVVPLINPANGDTVGIAFSSPDCVDCRLRGTNVKPSFWP